ncbi:conserved hypothetical protein [uncultured Mycobacterium sp.]|uniref:DUF4192 domain-containing protein n=1 Tax=uncultured Mycobacterium sp. TaxID=171292 RepID=A0A1Y5PJ81_9MYCO|nr:conserved hypothetical protein [uncultured Mycobacterium sp.]
MTKSFINPDTAQAVISAIPALLRFVPTNSIVAVMFGLAGTPREEIRFAIRFDLDRQQAQDFPHICSLHSRDTAAAILVAICDPEHEEQALDALNAARAALHHRSIQVLQMLTTHSLTEPGRWYDPDTGEHGPTVAYTDAAITADVVYQGSPIRESRDALDAEFALTKAAPYLATAKDFDDLIARTVTELHALITGTADAPTEDLATRAAIIVTTDVHIRDGLLRLGVGNEQAAAQTWTTLAAQLRGQARAEILTIAAFNYYIGGDGVRAGVAIDHAADTAEAAELPLPTLADLLNAALLAGIEPEKIRMIIPTREHTPLPGSGL